MAGQVEHITDLGLVNYIQHPTNPKYIVFRFAHEERANAFEEALSSNNIWFEKDQQQVKKRVFYLFGVHRNDYSKVQQINFNVEAMHRSFLIKNNFFRYFLLLFVFGVIGLAIAGYCTRTNILEQYEQTLD